MNTFVRFAAFGIAAAATVTLAACSSGETTAGSSTAPATVTATTSTSSVAPSATAAPGAMSSSGARNAGTHNDTDVTFVSGMIAHHQSAIEMADLAVTRADSQQVKDLAVAIKAAQAPEVEEMTAWLQAWDAGMAGTSMMSSADDRPGTSMMSSADGIPGMDNMGDRMDGTDDSGTQMPGMTADQITELTDATGTTFDRLFLQLMIVHHQGAVQTADTELAHGSNPDALALAESIKTGQTQEIAVMQQLLQNQ